ncbi:zinc-dependent alcohol dehydrogenase [Aidingimonas halophila]|uniref:2-desacetyl-2-hydroxyethyl bacteriochlorophyllide A dehydrogenase n=1 Tax=Aidingimonas halophila TaxID=574349 RepID=A0A1H3EAD0_9GAMM|nr:zinc-binding alcohol dehydrogenase [Aidingimonas halophila]GHC33823.1 dehydrogenase [Aidingimonas halophila]SDX75666.1 2-desacetyl-2-hydroxyethyl bacteriochlorophyllide A dehydrogenase [Aidingimonas halophila]
MMMSKQATAFWTAAAGRGELRDEALEPPDDTEVLIDTHYSAISRGTESLVFAGRVPPSEYQRMRAPFQEGEFPFPVKYGYASVGRVEQGSPDLQGREVFCLHPHQDRYVVPAEAVIPLPPGIPAERAVLAANMETAVNALWDAMPMIGDRICVVGGGVIGMLVAYLCAGVPGTHTCLIDIASQRQALAEALGIGFQLPEMAPTDNDLVIHASGSPSGLSQALALAGYEATLLEMSWYGDQDVPLPLGSAFHSQRLTLRSSQVGGIPAARRARWSHRRRLSLALSLLDDPRLDVLISGESDFRELPSLMPVLMNDEGKTLCHRIRYDAQR